MRRVPYAHATLLMALDEHHQPPEVMVIRAAEPQLHEWRATAQRGYHPRRLVLAIPADAADLPGALAGMAADAGPLAYRCRGTHCDSPIPDLDSLRTACA
jgi:uncharacterized protein YyaL (SSP411 family)